jgi:hypothetical protein
MALNFPASPTPGQIYENYIWNDTVGVWQSTFTNINSVITSPTTGQILEYDGTRWVNGQVDTAGIADGAVFGDKLGPGTVLQVVQTVVREGTYSVTIGTGTRLAAADVTGLTVTITPRSTSSKVIVDLNAMFSVSNEFGIILYRDGSPLTDATGDVSETSRFPVTYGAAPASPGRSLNFKFIDSPNTTSAVTYSIRFYNGAGSDMTVLMNRMSGESNTNRWIRAISTITATEVAA